jgi:hypothetical protein
MTRADAFRNTTAEPPIVKRLEARQAALPQRVVKAHPAANSIHHDMAQVLSLPRVTFDYLEPL